jgi:cystathionine gamma-synthase
MDAEARTRAGNSDGLLRLSVGSEAIEELLIDIRAALERAALIA